MVNGNGIKIIDLFAGLGGIRLGFEKYGCNTVYTSEWDVHAQKMYENYFGDRPDGDITLVNPKDIPDHDILLAGFPCQPFSIIGSKKGFTDTRGTLFFHIEEILRHKKPYAFLLENVKNLRTHDKGNTFNVIVNNLEELGYKVYETVLNTLNFGLPQKRERTFIVGFLDNIHFKFPKGSNHKLELKDILEPEEQIPTERFVSERIKQNRYDALKKEPYFPSMWHQNMSGNVSILPYSCALRATGSYNYLLVNGNRRLTGREMMRLQGFPDDYPINVSYTQMRKLAGNSVSVPVIEAIAKELLFSMTNRTQLNDFKQLFLYESNASKTGT